MKKQGYLGIRNVILTAGLSAVLAGAGMIAGNKTGEFHKIPVNSARQEQVLKKGSLEELARIGLPKEFQDMGFTIGNYVKRDTEKEIIILVENHLTGDSEQQARFMEYLSKKYGINSLGLESCSGEGKDIYIPVKSTKRKGFSFDPTEPPEESLRKIKEYFDVHNLNISLYGIEDDLLLNLVNTLNFGRDLKKQDLLKRIRNLRTLPHGFSESDLSFNDDDSPNYEKNDTKYSYNERNKAFARNIRDYIEKNKLKRSAIIVGALHADVPYELGYPKELDTLQEYLPYSYLIVYCGLGANPRQEKNPYNP